MPTQRIWLFIWKLQHTDVNAQRLKHHMESNPAQLAVKGYCVRPFAKEFVLSCHPVAPKFKLTLIARPQKTPKHKHDYIFSGGRHVVDRYTLLREISKISNASPPFFLFAFYIYSHLMRPSIQLTFSMLYLGGRHPATKCRRPAQPRRSSYVCMRVE